MRHVDLPLMRSVLAGELPPAVLLRFVLEHLAERCPECGEVLAVLRSVTGGLPGQSSDRRSPPEYPPHVLLPDPRIMALPTGVEREAVDWASRVRRERRLAHQDLVELLRLPREARKRRVVAARSRFRSRAFAELLLDEVRRRVRNEPEEAESLAALMPTVLLWTPGAVGREWAVILGFRAAAWRANAMRVAGRLREARRSFADLRQALARSPVEDGGLRAEIFSLEASLHLDQRRPHDARRLLDEAAILYRQAGDSEGLGRVLVQRGIVEQRADNPEEAAETYRQVLASETCRASSSVTAVTAAANLALALWQLGRSAEAAAVLGEHEALFRDHADDRARPLVMNVRGRVAWALGHRVEAERLLLEARNDLIAQKSPLYAAVVSLDLAVLYLEDGRTAEVKRMARLVGEMFESEEVDPLVTAALMVFRTALAAERLTVEAIRTLQRQLDEARQGPVQRKRP